MKINMHEWLEELKRSKERKALPIMTYPGLNMVNKKVMDVITNGQNQSMCIEALSRKYPSIAAMTIMDLSVEAEAFGSKIKFSEKEVPAVLGKVVEDMESADNLKKPAVGDGRTNVYLEAAGIASRNIKGKPVFGGIIGPFSLAGRLMDMTEIMITMMEEPEIVNTVLKKCTDFLVSYAKAFRECGASGIIIAEPASGLLPPDKCRDFSSKYVKRIVDAVQDQYFMVILHNCGKTEKLVDSMVSTGAKGLHFGNAIHMKDILPQIPSDRIAFGNIEPAGIFKNGTAQEMKEKVWQLLEDMKPYKNFVLSSGCDVPPGTPLDNVEAFFQTLADFNAKL